MHYGHDASAALIINGKIISNISSERITRIKKDGLINYNILEYIFKNSGIGYTDIDAISVSGYDVDKSFSDIKVFSLDGIPIKCLNFLHTKEYVEMYCIFFGKKIKVFVVPHHLGHAASSYYTSSFNKAICLTLDSSSPNKREANSLIAIGENNKLNSLESSDSMISQIYTAFTSHLRLGPPYAKAGSLMGLAGYGKPIKEVVKNIDNYINQSYGEGDMFNHYTELFKKLSGDLPITEIENVNDYLFYKNIDKKYDKKIVHDLAATAQFLFERCVLDIIEKKIKPYGIKNLCLAGGSFLNCNTNSLIKSDVWFENIHHCPASGDDGIALGSALYVAHHIFDEPRTFYSDSDIAYMGNNYEEYENFDYEKIADFIADGKIVAWSIGKSEFGPRALGHRSLLADPRSIHNKEKLNFCIKNREWFRPFAPSVLEEEAKNWFNPSFSSPFMLYTQNVLNPNMIPAVTHVDNTARIQTVSEGLDKDYYRLIKAFFLKTGVPMVLNTSLNGGGEPIVESDEDVLNLFNTSEYIDILVLNGKIYEK